MPQPSRLVLLGHPVAHSLSPRFQNAALRAARIPLGYEALDVAPAALTETLKQLVREEAAGNVTIPYKEAVAARCAVLTPIADRVGAVNTFWVDGGVLVGDNTDVGGFDAAVRALMDAPPHGGVIAVLGAGGSAAAAVAAAAEWTGCEIRVWSRTRERSESLAQRVTNADVHVHATPEDAVRDAHLVVNATPLGLYDDLMIVPVDALSPRAAVLDLVYRDGETAWVRAARASGHRAADGLTMLLEQGALSFERWFGVVPDRGVMRSGLTGLTG